MTRAFAVAAVVCALAACGASARPVRVAAALPPPASTWPRYPTFPASCWTRTTAGKPLADAPSYVSRPTHRTPEQVASAVLRRLGDTRYVRRVEFAPPPPVTRQHTGAFPHGQPPHDALWAYVATPPAHGLLAKQVAEWEEGLVTGALRDDMCAAGGAPLVGWTVGGSIAGVSDSAQALGQRFPNESRAVFRRRLALVGKKFGFRVESMRLLQPLQLAPLVVVRTDRDRKPFVRDVQAIMALLDPRNGQAVTFEGFFLAAEDGKGPFVSVYDVYRGEVLGGGWSWNRCVFPFPHSDPPTIGGKPRC